MSNNIEVIQDKLAELEYNLSRKIDKSQLERAGGIPLLNAQKKLNPSQVGNEYNNDNIRFFGDMGRSAELIKVDPGYVGTSNYYIHPQGTRYYTAKVNLHTINSVPENYLIISNLTASFNDLTHYFHLTSSNYTTWNTIGQNIFLAPITYGTDTSGYISLQSLGGGSFNYELAKSSNATISTASGSFDISSAFPAWVTGTVVSSGFFTESEPGIDTCCYSANKFGITIRVTFTDTNQGGITVGWARYFVALDYTTGTPSVSFVKISETHEVAGPGVDMGTPYGGGNIYCIGNEGSTPVLVYAYADKIGLNPTVNSANLAVINTSTMTVSVIPVTGATLGSDYWINMATVQGNNYTHEYVALSSTSWRSNDDDDRPWFACYQWNGSSLVELIPAQRPRGGDYPNCHYRMTLVSQPSSDSINRLPVVTATSVVSVPDVFDPNGNQARAPLSYRMDLINQTVSGNFMFGLTEMPTVYGEWAVTSNEYTDFLTNKRKYGISVGSPQWLIFHNSNGSLVKIPRADISQFTPVTLARGTSDAGLSLQEVRYNLQPINLQDVGYLELTNISNTINIISTTGLTSLLLANNGGGGDFTLHINLSVGTTVLFEDGINPYMFESITSTTSPIQVSIVLEGGVIKNIHREYEQLSHGFVVGDLIRHNGTQYVKAQANTAVNSEVYYMVNRVRNANVFNVALPGTEVHGLTGLTAGTTYFLDQTTAGTMTSIEPVSGITKPVFLAISTTSGIFISMRGVTV